MRPADLEEFGVSKVIIVFDREGVHGLYVFRLLPQQLPLKRG